METVIKKLSEIENAAKTIMADANGQVDVLKGNMDEKTAAFDIKVKEDTDKKLEALRQELQSQTNDALAKLKADTEANLASVHQYYKEHHDELSESIYKKIIGT